MSVANLSTDTAEQLKKSVSLVHPSEVGHTLSKSDATIRHPRVPQHTGHHSVSTLNDQQEDEQIASHGTLMLEKDGRSQYLGPTAGSEWLKDVGESTQPGQQLRPGSLKCENRQLHHRKQPVQVLSPLNLASPFRAGTLRPQSLPPRFHLACQRKVFALLNYLRSCPREKKHGS